MAVICGVPALKKEMIGVVRWLHISDLHIAEHADWNNFKNELLQKCQEHGKIDLVIVTGDFHNFSEHTDFHFSADFLRNLIRCLGLDIQQDLFIVPGNHDGVSDVQEKDIHIKAAKYDPFTNMAQWVVNLLAAFQGYETFVKALIPNYPEEHPAKVHSRIWRGTINFIHCNTALGADGAEKTNQLLDINSLATTAYQPDMPNIILAHNSFFDLHEKLQSRVKDTIRTHSVCAYFCGDRHTRNVDQIPLNGWSIPCVVSYKGAPDPKDNHSTFGVIFGNWDGELAKLTGWRWESGTGFQEDKKITGNQFPMRATSTPPLVAALNVQEPAAEESFAEVPSVEGALQTTDDSDTQTEEYKLKNRFISRYYMLSHRQRFLFNQKHADMQLRKEMSPVELSAYVNRAQEEGILEQLVQELASLLASG